ncbi:MAG: hypothetical protein ALECFALPRED_010618 [Alectoria fallacina]|uniref:Uncharacterized protein n=1 Tax=Alectoria fallacina TaxID=1903189 RepID=A0A8H3J926_9LECA|nr:MAG: hypothetical protein ALECFALPRED_010618 [Alectoria fallacina]
MIIPSHVSKGGMGLYGMHTPAGTEIVAATRDPRAADHEQGGKIQSVDNRLVGLEELFKLMLSLTPDFASSEELLGTQALSVSQFEEDQPLAEDYKRHRARISAT